MRDFFEDYKWDGRPFILAGMGPSFNVDLIREVSLNFNVLGINKVVREVPVDLCHIIDWYIVDKVRIFIESQAKYLVTPYFPHFAFKPNLSLTLRDITTNLSDSFKDKILAYNLSTIKYQVNSSPVIKACYFNAEASLNLIAHLGCKKVYAIGIDGGVKRANEFSDHGPVDPRGFDLQWDTMARTIVRHGIDYQNLDGSPIHPLLQEKIDAILQKV